MYKVLDMNLEEFVAHFSMRLYSRHAIQLGLMLAQGNSLDKAVMLVCANDPVLAKPAIAELIRVGYMSRDEKEVN